MMTVYIDTGNITGTLGNITNLLNQLVAQGAKQMTMMDDVNTALANIDVQIKAVADDVVKFAADLAAALANNNTAAAQAALDGINQRAAQLQQIASDNPAP